MALPQVGNPSNAQIARQAVQQDLFQKMEVQQLNFAIIRNTLLESIDNVLMKMFQLQQQKFNIDMLDRQRQFAMEQIGRRDKTIEKDEQKTGEIAKLPGLAKALLGLAGALSALGATFLGFRGFINPIKNGQLAIKLLRAIYIAPINFFKNLGIRVGKLLRLDVAFEKLKKFFLSNRTLNYLFGGSRNLNTGQFQRLGLIPRVINLVSDRVTGFFRNFKLPTLSGLQGRGGAFAMIKGLFNRVLSPIRSVGNFIANSKIFNNPLVRGGIMFFKTVFSKLLWPLGILISGFEGVKQAISSDEESFLGKFVDGITTAIGDFLGAPLDMLKNALAWLLRKAFGVELGEDGRVKADQGVMGSIIQGLYDFSFEDMIKGFLMLPFNMVKAAINTVKALFTGEEDPLRFIRDPVMQILRPILGFLDAVKEYIIEKVKNIPGVGKLFKTDEEKLLVEAENAKEELGSLQKNREEQLSLIAAEREKINDLKKMISTGNFDESWFGIGVNSEEEARQRIANINSNIQQMSEQALNQQLLVKEKEKELAEIETALAMKKSALEELDAVSTASGNGAAEAMRALEAERAVAGGMTVTTSTTDASVKTINKSETIVGSQKVSPTGYYNYEGRFALP